MADNQAAASGDGSSVSCALRVVTPRRRYAAAVRVVTFWIMAALVTACEESPSRDDAMTKPDAAPAVKSPRGSGGAMSEATGGTHGAIGSGGKTAAPTD